MNTKGLLDKVDKIVREVYPKDYNPSYRQGLETLIQKWSDKEWENTTQIDEKNIYLIAYGDSIFEQGKKTLPTLLKFLHQCVGGTISDVHLLPMFPYTSDDGFSVVDYTQIDAALGDWGDIQDFSKEYRLMFDFVVNHISQSSEWFAGYLQGEPKYKDYFIPLDANFDSTQVVRPRVSPLFHEYQGSEGVKTAWTTFSKDQVDLNFSNFEVLLATTDILLQYAHRGATSIRLDAIGFLWKQSGTPCIHLKQTHQIIQLWRLVLEHFKPHTQIITETNVPHSENISYFGTGTNEAQMVYQFSLPPLVLHMLTVHDSSIFSKWARGIGKVSKSATYFNFLASHDGIGLRPTEGLLDDAGRKLLMDKVQKNGGRVSYKNNTDGTQTGYELNINYADALINQEEDVTEDLQVQKILAAHAILLSMMGVPALYYHSLLGSRNDTKAVQETGINRRINREKLEFDKIVQSLQTDNRRKQIFERLQKMIAIRKSQKAFYPYAPHKILDLGNKLLGIERRYKGEKITLVLNASLQEQSLVSPQGIDLLTEKSIGKTLVLHPYEFVWIKSVPKNQK